MLLFQKRFHQGLTDGSVTLTFRRWTKPLVRAGGRYRCHPIGVLQVDGVEKVRVSDITDTDAKRAGFESRAALVSYLATARNEPLEATTQLFRIELHHGGDGDRIPQALVDTLTEADVKTIVSRLQRMDEKQGPWTRATLRLIEKRPRVAASQLARSLKRETLPFKEDVRKLKKLGLTQSFEVGYELSPRGKAFLARRKRW